MCLFTCILLCAAEHNSLLVTLQTDVKYYCRIATDLYCFDTTHTELCGTSNSELDRLVSQTVISVALKVKGLL